MCQLRQSAHIHVQALSRPCPRQHSALMTAMSPGRHCQCMLPMLLKQAKFANPQHQLDTFNSSVVQAALQRQHVYQHSCRGLYVVTCTFSQAACCSRGKRMSGDPCDTITNTPGFFRLFQITCNALPASSSPVALHDMQSSVPCSKQKQVQSCQPDHMHSVVDGGNIAALQGCWCARQMRDVQHGAA